MESFWSLWTHLSPPSGLQPTTDYLVFHAGVQRPVWEDPLNLSGGKWIIRLKKGTADRIWEDLVLAIIGDQFQECHSSMATSATSEGQNDGEPSSVLEWPEICGCTISVRQHEDIVSLWNRVDGDIKVREKIRYAMSDCYKVPIANNNESGTRCVRFSILPRRLSWSTSLITVSCPRALCGRSLVILLSSDSMQDKSSFRNSAIDRTAF